MSGLADRYSYEMILVNDFPADDTFEVIRKLAEEESVTELARMLGSDSITENVMNNAREMKDLARKTKQY